MLKKLNRAATISDEIYQALKKAIIHGDVAAGEPIVETNLAEQLGASRTPVREALKKLISDGVLIPNGERGLKVIALDKQTIFNNCEIRALLETGALHLSFKKHKAPLIHQLESLIDQMAKAMDKDKDQIFNDLDNRFHLALFAHTDNDNLTQIYDRINIKVQITRYQTLTTQASMGESQKEHQAIIQALQEDNFEQACALIHNHAFNQYKFLEI